MERIYLDTDAESVAHTEIRNSRDRSIVTIQKDQKGYYVDIDEKAEYDIIVSSVGPENIYSIK